MTLAQRIVTVAAALAIWGTGAYPPWMVSYVVKSEVTQSEAGIGGGQDHPAVAAAVANEVVSTAIGNDWLINEKSVGDQHIPGFPGLPSLRRGIGFSVDYGRLAVEWIIIAALCAALISALAPAKPPPSAPK